VRPVYGETLSARLSSPSALALAVLLPLIFIHGEYQPSWSVAALGDTATLYLSDLAVFAIAGLGLVAGLRHGFAPLRPALPVLLVAAAFLVLVFVATAYGDLLGDDYDFGRRLLTALKLGEYGLIVVALPLILRTAEDVRPSLWTLTLWSVAASVGAVLQFLGLVNEFEGRRPGQREPSFLGIHDLAALSGATLALGLAVIALAPLAARDRRLGLVAAASGAVGLILSGAVAGVIGVAGSAAAAALVARRRSVMSAQRAVAIAALVATVAAGVIAIRGGELVEVLETLGIERARDVDSGEDASWQQRVVLAYIGGRIFEDNPVVGVGWQASSDQEHYGQYVPDARRRFPDVASRAFPSPEHPWGVQNAYIQAGSDMGVLGLAAFLGLFATSLAVSWRAAARASPNTVLMTALPMLWLLVAMGVWIGIGLVAGTPLGGLTVIALGLSAAAASWTATRDGS
jgi:O-antigen ligase